MEVGPLDPLDGPVAAPRHHTVVFENQHVRVLETLIRVGDTAPLHTHLNRHVIVVKSGSHFIRRDEHGATLLDTRAMQPPFVMPRISWSDGIPAHTLENTGDDDVRVIAIELK